MPHKVGIHRRKLLKKIKITLSDTPRLLSTPSCVLSKRKPVHYRKLKEKSPADYYFTPLIINDDLNMDDKSCGNYSTKNYTISQHKCDYNNGDVSSGYVF